jgi:hypothetical protein
MLHLDLYLCHKPFYMECPCLTFNLQLPAKVLDVYCRSFSNDATNANVAASNDDEHVSEKHAGNVAVVD